MRNALSLLSTLLFVFMVPALVFGQGMLVHTNHDDVVRLPRPIIWPRPTPQPVPPSSYKIKELAVQARLSDQIARVQVSQTFVNTGSRQMEVSFVFPLPYDGAIDKLTLMVDGKEFEAKLLEKDEARRIYESIVRKNQDPALLEWMGTGMFKTSVFPVPAGAARTVTLRYAQLCRKSDGLTDFLFPLSTAKYTSHPVENVNIRVSLDSADKIKNVYSPTHSIDIERPDAQHAVVKYASENKVPTSDFRLLFDSGEGKVSTKVLSYRPDGDQDGYFLLLASPEIAATDEQQPNKTVVFVVDRSGSMSGKKIEQAKGALKFVMENLRDGDLFNIVAYDSEVESFRPELQKYDEKTRVAALGFVEGIYAGGSTNIEGALRTTLKQLTDSSRPTYVIFLTDGLPTTGETSEMKIVTSARARNKVGARLFSFGVGFDVNSRLLDKLTVATRGQSEYVKPDEDIEDRVSRLYNKIGRPVLTDVAIKIDVEGAKAEDGQAVNRIYPKDSYDLFAGEQLVVVGRYSRPGAAKVIVSGRVRADEQTFDFPAKLVKKSDDETTAFVEKLWAVRRIGEVIDELDLKGKNDELINELVTLSTQHGILTPYTSFLADENGDSRDLAANTGLARRQLEQLAEASGQGAFQQRAAKAAMKSADRAPAADEADGLFGIAGGAIAPAAPGAAIDAEGQVSGRREAAVMNVGRKSFYRRGERWVDAKVDADMEKKAIQLERYSKEYFDLITKHGKDVAKYLAIDAAVVIELDGEVYAF